MSKAAKIHSVPRPIAFDGGAVLNALADPIIVAEADGMIVYANAAAEEFFATSLSHMIQTGLAHLLPSDSPLFSLIRNVASGGHRVSEYEVELDTPRIGPHLVTLQVAPASDAPGRVVVSIHDQSIARKIDFQLAHRNAARSMTAMSAILAHEIKNPLSGIRGAAQLLEQGVSLRERDLTRLICDEVDRICALVDRFEMFSDKPSIRNSAVNIHEVLDHVQRLAQNGFARNVHFLSVYDPSLPPVRGNRDQLIQVFLNLVKNAAEAVPKRKGEIVLSTNYRHGIRLAVGGGTERQHLPLVISVQDNGEGIPEDIRAHLFDPFITTKANGNGLGLAIVAKIVDDLGGAIEFDSQPGRTVFRVMLPVASAAGTSGEGT